MQLSEIIINKIKQQGPLSFHDFMEMSLYYPELGYYTSPSDRIGHKGDFYTSSNLTPAFGAMIGRQLEEMWRKLDEAPFTIVEYGAGTGALCHDILDYLKNNEPLYRQLRYCIIEKSPTMRAIEQSHLHEKVTWHDSITEIAGFSGCVLSNELLDNFSIHQVEMHDDLMEVFVDYRDGFTEILLPAASTLKDYFTELKVSLPKGFHTEVNLEAIDWIRDIAQSMKQGYILTIDYGFPTAELYVEQRSRGTLMCYHKHQINEHPYDAIGEQDITSHVNFSALYHWGLKYGIEGCGFTDQGHFLMALGFEEYLTKLIDPAQDAYLMYKRLSNIRRTLLLDMGRRFKVFIQNKDADPGLLGLKYA